MQLLQRSAVHLASHGAASWCRSQVVTNYKPYGFRCPCGMFNGDATSAYATFGKIVVKCNHVRGPTTNEITGPRAAGPTRADNQLNRLRASGQRDRLTANGQRARPRAEGQRARPRADGQSAQPKAKGQPARSSVGRQQMDATKSRPTDAGQSQ